MFVEFHLLQNFAPNNLNRDDTGAPKDCTFGGVRRARISSQCLKHAIRRYFDSAHLFGKNQLAIRTKRIVARMVQQLVEKGRDPETAQQVAITLLGAVDLDVGDDKKTQYLLYFGSDEIAALTDLCEQHWNVLDKLAAALKAMDDKAKKSDAEEPRALLATKPNKAKEEIPTLPEEVRKAILTAIGSSKAVDLALFGRMLADLPEKNIDAACQVAHAVSVNEVSMETDFYTAIDDLKPDDTQGADMMGTVEFNSSCFYRYAKIDLDLLSASLDQRVARNATVAFLRAMVAAIPSGKQNSMAAHNLPSYIRVIVRSEGEPSNLLNAFARPVRARRGGDEDLIQVAITALEKHYDQLARLYAGSENDPGTQLVANVFDDKSLSFSALLKQLATAIEVKKI